METSPFECSSMYSPSGYEKRIKQLNEQKRFLEEQREANEYVASHRGLETNKPYKKQPAK